MIYTLEIYCNPCNILLDLQLIKKNNLKKVYSAGYSFCGKILNFSIFLYRSNNKVKNESLIFLYKLLL